MDQALSAKMLGRIPSGGCPFKKSVRDIAIAQVVVGERGLKGVATARGVNHAVHG